MHPLWHHCAHYAQQVHARSLGRTKQDAVHLLQLIVAAQIQHCPELAVNICGGMRRGLPLQCSIALCSAAPARTPQAILSTRSCTWLA